MMDSINKKTQHKRSVSTQLSTVIPLILVIYFVAETMVLPNQVIQPGNNMQSLYERTAVFKLPVSPARIFIKFAFGSYFYHF